MTTEIELLLALIKKPGVVNRKNKKIVCDDLTGSS